MRGATWAENPPPFVLRIATHAPHAGRDANAEANERHDNISIHAPHAGRDIVPRLS